MCRGVRLVGSSIREQPGEASVMIVIGERVWMAAETRRGTMNT